MYYQSKVFAVYVLPNEWVDGALVFSYQGKVEKGICDNYHGITLLDLVDKIISIVLLNQLL